MTIEEAKKMVTDEVNNYPTRNGKKVYLSKMDFYFFAGGLVYSSSDIDKMTVLQDIRAKLSGDEWKQNREAY